MSRPRARSLGRRVSAAALGVLLAALLLESGHRVWRGIGGRSWDAEAAATRIRAEVDLTSAWVPRGSGEGKDGTEEQGRSNVLHPYAGSEGAHDTGGVLAAFRDGLPEDAFVVLVLGGSVAAGFADHAVDANGTHVLARALTDSDPALAEEVVVLNYAHAAYKQPQQLMRLAYLLSLGNEPDAVVLVDGYNEVMASARNAGKGIHPAYPSPSLWSVWLGDGGDRAAIAAKARLVELADEKRALGETALGFGLHRSSVLGTWVLARLRGWNREGAALQRRLGDPEEASEGQRRQRSGPPFDPDPRAVLELSARIWHESSRSLHALCAARGIRYLHVLQPALHDEGSKVVSAEEEAILEERGEQESVRLGYPLLRERGARLREEGVAFLDASGVFRGRAETLYHDSVHFDGEGLRIFSTLVAERFHELVATAE